MNGLLVAWLLAAASTSRLTVIDGSYQIPRGDWNYVELRVVRPATLAHCQFEVDGGKTEVRVTLLKAADLEAMRAGRDHPVLAVTAYAPAGKLRQAIQAPGEYAVAIENRKQTREAAQVKLTVWLESERVARELPPGRRAAVIAASLAVFVALVAYAWRKLAGSVR
ncbi:MAG: hypothetical protein HYR60_12290 [Acidobacteria bacterium]|nr:hypothetical protein [Acidobacteriota bacterium]MBI3471215.1 hypothetical protein [Candidatus Solibacter usitatus]